MTACCGVVVDVAHDRLDPAAALDFVSDPAFGGFTMFVGRVRDMNHGRAVAGVSIEDNVPVEGGRAGLVIAGASAHRIAALFANLADSARLPFAGNDGLC